MGRRWKLGLGLALLLLVLAGFGSALVYVRLLNGPISLQWLVADIERAISSEMDGRLARIDAAELRLASDGGFQVGLRNIVIRERDGRAGDGPDSGAILAQAPSATITPSARAFWRGKLAIERVDLVAPRLQVQYSEDGSLSLRFQKPGEITDVAVAANTPTPVVTEQESAADGRIDIIKTLADGSARARRREHATAYLREFGLKDATVVVDHAGRKSIWHVPDLQLGFDHKAARSSITGQATIASLAGPWTLAFSTFEAEDAKALQLKVQIANFIPRGVARALPQLALLEGLDVPLSADALFELTTNGDVRSGQIDMSIQPGRVFLPWFGRLPLAVDRGTLAVRYDGAAKRFDLEPSTLSWAQNTVRLKGAALRRTVDASKPLVGGGRYAWDYEISSIDGALAGDDQGAAIPIERVLARGVLSSATGQMSLAEFVFRAGGGEISASGDASGVGGVAGSSPQVLSSSAPSSGASGMRAELNGQISPMSADVLKKLWPRTLAPDARRWIIEHLNRGQLTSGQFKLATQGVAPSGDQQALPDTRLSLTIEATGLALKLAQGVPALEIPKSLVRVEGQTLEVTAADASILASDNKRLSVKGLRFTAVETNPNEQAIGEVAFRVSGPLAAALDIADRDPMLLLKSNGIILSGVEGKIDGQFKLTMPIAENVQPTEIKTEGKLRISDGRLRQAVGPHDISGAAISIDVSDKAIDVKGEMLIKGVPVKLGGQHVFYVPPERQSPIRLTANLDTADRAALGLELNDVVQGEVPLELTITRDVKGDTVARVRADLTKAELTLESIAWKKAAGRAAVFQFDPVRTQNNQRIELQNVRLVGDDVAMEGNMALGPDGKLREFTFPDFSINVVTRLDVQGKLRGDNVWDVKAKGTTFDGRELFRGLFSVGQAAEKSPSKDKAGLDLTAEIDTIIGFSDTTLRSVSVRAQKRADKLTDLDVRGQLEGGKPFIAMIRSLPGKPRQLLAESSDAGRTFKLVGFYPSAVGGTMQLEVDLDAKGVAEKSGTLWAQNFAVLGDSVFAEVIQSADTAPNSKAAAAKKKVYRQQFDFDRLRIPFVVGSGQFVMNGAQIQGPVVGATMKGKLDFKSQQVRIGGTYVPLSGLNSALGAIPLFGQILAGPQGEGILGVTFAIDGPMANPQVIVNPFSLIAPGITREIFQMTEDNPRIIARDDAPIGPRRSETKGDTKAGPRVGPKADAGKSDQTGARTSSTLPTARVDAPATPRATPETLPDWASDAKGGQKR
jgi:AsmA-like C-terminal region